MAIRRDILQWLALPVLASAVEASTPSESNPHTFFEYNCIDCHDEYTAKGGLTLDLEEINSPAKNSQIWELVLRKLRHRQMPPPGEDRPEESSYEQVIASLMASLDRSAAERPNPGRTETFRRLNRTEYRNAIRDLLDLEVDVSSLLPKDDISHGFDNVTVGELSPTLLERYLGAAKKISRMAVNRPVISPQRETIFLPLDMTQESHFDGMPLGTRGGGVGKFHFAADAEYDVQLRLTRDRYENVEGLEEPHEVEVLLDGSPVQRFEIVPPQDGEPHDNIDGHLRVRIPVSAGPHTIAATFVRKSSALSETESQPPLASFNLDRHPRAHPALFSITVYGPYDPAGVSETPSRRRIFGALSTGAACDDDAQKIIANLMRRAFRRPVTAADLEQPLRFYAEAAREEGFEAGIEMALRAILVSPHFLFRIEHEPEGLESGAVYRISELHLASRLSFFLWSSIPDDKLLEAAASGELGESNVLEEQVRRMLKDPRSAALVDSFAAQWLHLRNLETVTPDARLFRDFDQNLRQSLRRESELLFENILRENRSVLDLLRADYTYLNERLARHYGIPHVYGSHFRRVSLAENGRRGGLLTHGSVLTVTSHANRTSPVLRGDWVLRNILGTPPKPPPPDIPQLQEKTADGVTRSIREQMAKHRESRTCAACHDLMDPVGFALEHFDPVGRWRDTDGNFAIDTSGNFPNGTKFDSAATLQQAILKRPDLFAETVTQKLLTYALGRGMEAYDAPAVRQIVRAAAEDEYRLSALIVGVVQSVPFQMRKSQ